MIEKQKFCFLIFRQFFAENAHGMQGSVIGKGRLGLLSKYQYTYTTDAYINAKAEKSLIPNFYLWSYWRPLFPLFSSFQQ